MPAWSIFDDEDYLRDAERDWAKYEKPDAETLEQAEARLAFEVEVAERAMGTGKR